MSHLSDALDQVGVDVSTLMLLYEENGQTLFQLTVPHQDAYAVWRTLYNVAKRTGHLPIIMGDDREIKWLRSTLAMYTHSDESIPSSIVSIIESGLTLDVKAWLARELRGNEFSHGPWSEEVEAEPDDDWYPARYYTDNLTIALVPTLLTWQLPAYLKFGNFNACPVPEEHVALFKRWDQLVGLQVIHMSHDTIDAHICRPPTDRELAVELTQEHFAYCGETAGYGTTVENYAALLMKGQPWHFWWD